jgi:hypothetical protein
MIEFFTEKNHEMELKIKSILNENKVEYFINKIKVIEETLESLRDYILRHSFENDLAEINYFKDLKPLVVSQLVLNKRLLQIEYEKPQGSINDKIEHLKSELKRLNRYSKANTFFLQYIRSGKTDLDENYFLRRNAKKHQMFESFACEIDYNTGTGFDYRIAVIQAHDKIENHLQEQIDALKNHSLKNNFEFYSPYDTTCGIKKMKWTISQADLVELIYGLYTMKAFNHGASEIKEIAEFLEDKFNVKLNNVYRSFSDIKNRKSVDRFKFISQMLEHLDNATDENFMNSEKN